MTFSIHGLAVARGIAMGRAVLVASSRVDVAHYFIQPDQIESEIERVVHARECVIEEINKLQQTLPKDAPPELAALLDVHMMLLQDEMLASGINTWVRERSYNAEWALSSQLEIVARQFDEMEDPYLRERKGDLEQVVERILRHLKGDHSQLPQRGSPEAKELAKQQDLLAEEHLEIPLILVAHDLSPADLLQFKQSVFTGFVTDVGGKTSHTAIVAKSLDIPAVVGARTASHLIRQDDWLIVDGNYPAIGSSYFSYNGGNLPGASSLSGNGMGGFGYWFGSGQVWTEGTNSATYTAATTNDVGMIAYDPATGKWWAGLNGTWFNSGNPAAGTGYLGIVSASPDKMLPAFISYHGANFSVNFGQQPFKYTIPSGFTAMNTYNM